MKVYVGTYAKYNAGSLKGAWIDLDKFKNYEEFVKECRRVHRGEHDPEFMVQDVEHDGADWQAGFTGELLSGYADYWTIKAEAEKNGGEAVTPIGTVTRNEQKNGVEIKFFERPDAAILADLKAHGWRWSRFAGCWYNRYTEENAAYAAKVAGAASVSAGGAAPRKEEPNDENVNTPEIRELFSAEQAKNWGKDTRMVDYCVKSAEVVVRLTGGELVGIEKPSIKTEDCHGEDDRGQGGDGPGTIAFAQKCCAYFETEAGFKRTNIRGFDKAMVSAATRKEGSLWGEPLKFYVTTKYCGGENTLICDCNRTTKSRVSAIRREANAEDIRRLRIGYMMVRRSFVRRVNAYWRRFGNSKLRTWTYWTEA